MLTLSQRYWASKTTFTFGGDTFKCTRRTKSALLALKAKVEEKHPNALGPGRPARIQVLQGCYNTTVAASKGTHDRDGVLDIWIHGVSGSVAQATVRQMGWAGWHRTPDQGDWVEHIHMALLPPGIPTNRPNAWQVGAAYRSRGIVVGELIDGGLTMHGSIVTSSQIVDYYRHALGMRDHHAEGSDPSWHPDDISKTIFRPKGY